MPSDGVGTERWSPDKIERHEGDKECNHPGCKDPADWNIILIDRHACHGLFRTCDSHVEEHYGYHPERRTPQEGESP